MADGGKGIPLSVRSHRIALGGTVSVKYGNLPVTTAKVPVVKVVTVNGIILSELVNDNMRPLVGETFVGVNHNNVHDGANRILGIAEESFRDQDGDGKYTVRLSKEAAFARFRDDVAAANECYAQVGIRFVVGG